MKMLRTIVVIGSFLLISSTVSAQSLGDFVLELKGSSTYTTDEAFHAVSDANQVAAGKLGLGYGLEPIVSGLRAYFLFEGGGVFDTDRRQQTFDVDWSFQRYMLGVDYGVEIFGVLRPSARLAAGLSRQALNIKGGGDEISQARLGLAVQPSAGLEAYFPIGFFGLPFTVGVGSQFGYSFQTRADFNEVAREQEDDDPWTIQSLDAGEFSVSGLFWDIGLLLLIRL